MVVSTTREQQVKGNPTKLSVKNLVIKSIINQKLSSVDTSLDLYKIY